MAKTMKTYRNKATGMIASPRTTSKTYLNLQDEDGNTIGKIKSKHVENSPEWEEIEYFLYPELFIDGVNIKFEDWLPWGEPFKENTFEVVEYDEGGTSWKKENFSRVVWTNVLPQLKEHATPTAIIRFSDGEVFRVGDAIFPGPETIDEIKIYENGNCNLGLSQPKGFCNLNKAEKAYKVEDGWVKHGCEVFLVYRNPPENEKPTEALFFGNNMGKQDNILFFKSKENAQKYIEENKPKYSEKEVQEIAEEFRSWGVGSWGYFCAICKPFQFKKQ